MAFLIPPDNNLSYSDQIKAYGTKGSVVHRTNKVLPLFDRARSEGTSYGFLSAVAWKHALGTLMYRTQRWSRYDKAGIPRGVN
jgi:hypothetical protein